MAAVHDCKEIGRAEGYAPLTLASYRAVQGVTLDKERLACTFSVSFQDVYRLNGVFSLSATIYRFYSDHGIYGHRCKQVVVAVWHW